MVKYIIVPNYCPLYAMAKCFGPTHGPLTKPCPTPVDIIYELLLQTGVEKVHIYEVGYDVQKKITYGEPVQLNMNNYKTPYEQLIHTSDSKHDVGEIVPEEIVTSTVVTPTVITAEAETAPDEEVAEDVDVSTISEGEHEAVVTDSAEDVDSAVNDTPEAPAEEIRVEEKPVSGDQVSPPRRLSKSERRALRRHAEEQKREEVPTTEEVSE